MARLESFYVKIRQEVQVAATEAEASGRAPRAVPITVRPLEANSNPNPNPNPPTLTPNPPTLTLTLRPQP